MPVLNSIATQLRERSHVARLELLLRTLDPRPGQKILDLGSGWWKPFGMRLKEHADIDVTLADIYPPPDGVSHDARTVVLEPGGELPFVDAEFDLIVCNSVIEHATLDKEACRNLVLAEKQWRQLAYNEQRRLANEIRRVGRGYFVQTPHKHFPLDLHMWLPFTNWLPHEVLRRLVPVANRYWVKSNEVVDWNLLGADEMQQLFPEATIHIERLAGLPKSVVAVSRAERG
jgi:hypothetical protein